MMTPRTEQKMTEFTYKIVPLTKDFQKPIEAEALVSEAKKTLMKTLFVTDFHLSNVEVNESECVYHLTTDYYETPFFITKENDTDKLCLYQEDFLLENNQQTCEILFNKVH